MKCRVILVISVMIMLSGCNNTTVGNKNKQPNQVEKALLDGINKGTEKETAVNEDYNPVNSTEYKNGEIDIDLTSMSSSMVFSTVDNIMRHSADYKGKIIKAKGTFYSVWYEQNSQYYYYIVIQDATACCAQGFEFVWEDGTHIFPDEYPNEEAEIIVTGVFEPYYEDGTLYCSLNNATLEVQ